MTSKDEAQAQGIPLKDTDHSMKRRASWHDYSGKGIYMITLVVEGRKAILGTLLGKPHPHVFLSALGLAILNDVCPKMQAVYPNLSLWKVMIMPDHIHFILHVSEPFAKGKNLSTVIGGFKTGCNKAYRRICKLSTGALFEEGYNDKVLIGEDQLTIWKNYLDDNPRRLWVKRHNPEVFKVMRDYDVSGYNCSLVGNRYLLDIPNKEVVIYHRHYTDADLERLYNAYMQCGEMGGVLVSASIAPWEKKMMQEAADRGYLRILLRENGFPAIFKPSGADFDACAEGRLLLISPWEYHTERIVISRDKCMYLNGIAEKIAGVTQA